MKLGIYIKHMKTECRVPKSYRYDLHVKSQGHFIQKLHKSCPGHILYTISCIIILPCMQVRLGMMVCCIPLLGHCDLLFTVYCTSEENLVWPITFILFVAGSSNLACKYNLGWWCDY